MEVVEHKERKVTRDESPDRAQARRPPSSLRHAFKRIQIVYYLSRNGLLEHPHYMELTLRPQQHIRLKDVMERLTVLRGKSMPSLYSWSCKRSYKNGYVWNDLAENDVILPSESGEYVLKGSEIILNYTDKLQHLQLSQDSNLLHPKLKHFPSKRQEEEHEEKQQTCKSCCSRGVSTDEIEEFRHQNEEKIPQIEQTIDTNSSPPSTTESTHSDNSSNTLDATAAIITNNPKPTRFEDGDPVGIEPMLSRNSMLLSLIACGGSSSFRKSFPPPPAPARKSCSGLVRKMEVEDEDEMMIRYMSENPRLIGNLAAEEKEYFSGSIVEAVGNDDRLGGGDQRPGLKRSSSFNQERSNKAGVGEAARKLEEEEMVKREKGTTMKGKCIPRKRSSKKVVITH